MYYFNKVVGWVTSPLGMFFLGCSLAWLVARMGRKRLAVVLVVLAGGLLWILSCSLTTRFIGYPLEGTERSLESCLEQVESVDAVVVLGGGMLFHEQCGRPEMAMGADRVWAAARVSEILEKKTGVRPMIICTGGGVRKSTMPLLLDLGVKEAEVRLFENPRNTAEEASFIHQMLAKSGSPRIALVTSAWHLPRAQMLFERHGFEIVACPTDWEMTRVKEHKLELGDFMPSAEALELNSLAVKEWVGRVGYLLLK